jgi:amidase
LFPGGSIRIPAAFNGLYGIRPSAGRLPYEGMANSMDGQNSVLSVVGPLGTTAGAVKLAVKSILSQNPHEYDPMVIPMPWRDAEEQAVLEMANSASGKGPLAFAVFKSDGAVMPNPPVQRAIDLTVAAVQKAGHKVIEWKPPSHQKILEWVAATWLYDGGKDVHDAFGLSGEPPAKQVSMSYGTEAKGEQPASHISATNVKQRQSKKEYLDYWNSTAKLTGTGRPVDGIIAPLAPYPAARPEGYKYYGLSMWVNGLDLTSVVVPVTYADKSVDKYPADYKPISDHDKTVVEDYDAEIYDGAHVSVQIVGRRLTEEKMLAIAEYVGGLLGHGK